jgi:2'-5' RNA ligase
MAPAHPDLPYPANPMPLERQWGDTCFAVNLQIKPDASASRQILNRQRDLAARFGADLNLYPETGLHMTVSPVIYVRARYAVPSETIWRTVEPSVRAHLARTAATLAPIELSFPRLAGRGDAILLDADPHPAIEALRDAVTAALAGQTTAFRPKTTHSTIARLASPAGADWIEPLDEPVRWRSRSVRLVIEHRYPGLDESLVAAFALSGPAAGDT